MAKIIEIAIPTYVVTQKPDYSQVGRKIQDEIKKHFSGKLVVRAISMSKRNFTTLEATITEIITTGTDRNKQDFSESRGYEKSSDIQFFAEMGDLEGQNNFIEPYIRYFYEKPIQHGGPPERVDILILYDPNKVSVVQYKDKHGRDKTDGYRFKDQNRKQDAVLGVVKVLHWK